MLHLSHKSISKQGIFRTPKSFCIQFIIGALVLFFLNTSAVAAIYYIDYETGKDQNSGESKELPWKHCPGMVGFSGTYHHMEGDVFIFKGGVTWPKAALPLSISFSGSSHEKDTYRSDRTWYKGAQWSYPIFDAQGSADAYTGIVEVRGKSNIKIDGIKIYRVGQPGVSSNARGIIAINSSNLNIENCSLEIYGNHAIVISVDPTSPHSNIIINKNVFSNSANFIEIGLTTAGPFSLENLTVSNNIFRDSKSNLLGGDHGDGIHIFCKNNAPRLKNVRIHNNRWTGNFGSIDDISTNTAQIYFEDSVDGGLIFNNIFSFENRSTNFKGYLYSPAFIAIYGSRNIKIFNNNLVSDAIANATDGALSGVRLSGGHSSMCENIEIKNNIFSKPRLGIIIDSICKNIISDFNFFSPRAEGYIGAVDSSFKTIKNWQALGYDLNSKSGDPNFISLEVPFNLKVKPNSDVIDTGINIGEEFKFDIEGSKRPYGTNWDIGAYEFVGSITPPTGLKVK
jgi:hypothetical protein